MQVIGADLLSARRGRMCSVDSPHSARTVGWEWDSVPNGSGLDDDAGQGDSDRPILDRHDTSSCFVGPVRSWVEYGPVIIASGAFLGGFGDTPHVRQPMLIRRRTAMAKEVLTDKQS